MDTVEPPSGTTAAVTRVTAKTLKQEVGDERLSIERLQREAAARGTVGDDRSWNTKDEFGF